MKEGSRRGWVTPSDVVHALGALGGVIRDPNRTDLIGEFISSLSGPSGKRLFDAVWDEPVGRAILEEGRDLRATLSDRAALAALPTGSLGRTYYEWTATRQLDADGIADAVSGRVPRDLADPYATLAARVVDMHDLWHVVNGWDSDIHGELHLLGYSYAQLGGYAWYLLARLAVVLLATGGRREGAGYLRNAIDRGRRASLLAAADWEALLPLPLAEVRRRLGVDDPVPYRKLDFDEAAEIRAKSPVLRFLSSVLPA